MNVVPPLLSRLLPRLSRLLPPNSSVVVGTSGGPDSQALLHLLAHAAAPLQLKQVLACGIDHGRRPQAAQELLHAQNLANVLDVPFARQTIVVPTGGNLLAQARRERYLALQAHLQKNGATHLAVAHTATDQAETVLLHLSRGAGLRGAGGMPYKRGNLIRPLLDITREELLAYLASHAIAYANDPSNADPKRARAKLRSSILPALATLNPKAVQHLAAFAQKARQDDQLLRKQARHLVQTKLGGLWLAPLLSAPLPLAQRALMLWLAGNGLHAYAQHSKALLCGKTVRLPGGQRVGASRGRLWVLDHPHLPPLPLAANNMAIAWPKPQFLLTARLENLSPEAAVAFSSHTRVAFDADTLHLGLQVRTTCAGETFVPFGLHGTVKVGDLFTNMKIPTPVRRHWPLVTSGDTILWVAGLRRGATAPITAKTRRVLLLEVATGEDGKLHDA